MKKLWQFAGAIPFFLAVFLNAFVDLGHKIIIQNTVFKVYDGQEQIVLTAIVNGLILLPFILLLTPAGYLSDRFAKNKVMRFSAWVAVVLTLGITACYYLGWFWPAFAMTFLLAVQSALYSPAKFGYIKPLFGKERLAQANGLVQGVSIIAILAGTVVYSLLFEQRYDASATTPSEILLLIAPLGWILVANSLIELVMAYRLPQLEQDQQQAHFDWQAYRSGQLMKQSLSPLKQRSVIRLSIIGLSMFWAIGQMLLAAFPAYAKAHFDVTNTLVIQGTIATTGLGIALGSWLAGRWSKNHIETGLVPIGALGIAVALWLLPHMETSLSQAACFLVVGTMGGLFIVPLNSLIQFQAGEHEMGRVLAVNNWVQNVAMASFLLITAGAALYGLDSVFLISFTGIVAIIGGTYTVYKLPQSLVRVVISWILSRRYKISVHGMKNIPGEGGVLLLGNHISWIDWAILQIACPRPIKFVMQKSIYNLWYLKWFFKLVGCVPIESGASSLSSLKTVADLLDNGDVVALFPEGTISRTGHLAEFRRGYEKTCEHTQTEVKIVPFYLRGLWGSQFSRSSKHLKELRREGMFRDLVVAFGAPIAKDTKTDVLKRRVFDLSVQSWQSHVQELPSLSSAWISAVKRVKGKPSLSDSISGEVSAYHALVGAICIGRRMKKKPGQNVGLLLPTSVGGMLANMAALLRGKTLVNLNYTASEAAVKAAIEQADIRTVYSSKRFLKQLERRGINIAAWLDNVDVVMVEDISKSIGKREKLLTLIAVKVLPAGVLNILFNKRVATDSTAAILFSSGSEGQPKGVMLSHQNISANLKQISDVLNTQESDVVMASLPLFHAFGLTVTQFLPLVEGLPVVCHADPTDAAGIGKAVAKHQATIMCGTSTFLRIYTKSKKLHPLMFASLRIVVAGAERLNPEVRSAFQGKFNKTILEGYGTTETTPVASVNLPDQLDTTWWQVQLGGKPGTVGMPLPGTSFKVVDPNDYTELATGESGMVLIGGAQVMQGYLNNPEKTDAVIKLIDGQRWYVTGDKGHIDKDGFLTIVDRYSRFAKLGGEMVSLGAIEQAITPHIDKDSEIIAVAVADAKKGEKVILLHQGEIDSASIKQVLLETGINPLMLPAKWVQVDAVPKLGTGKTDYNQAKELALSMV
ncbi:acyl-[ACP]--phospholipid O-acyltransferase [Motilimonas pumila]|uniref:MFS transporter n=1 Tax=Motilimonas pumila TaxID=2303987 RepID=A0A418YDG4_9GAMM|nr:acyl-[ACP]--phospholipid O-acyltransferase [Motilimonas pumila]RJG42527.1 MFS transporter [Motilimonas pumila]